MQKTNGLTTDQQTHHSPPLTEVIHGYKFLPSRCSRKKKVTVIGTFAFHIHTSMEKNDVMGVTYWDLCSSDPTIIGTCDANFFFGNGKMVRGRWPVWLPYLGDRYLDALSMVIKTEPTIDPIK